MANTVITNSYMRFQEQSQHLLGEYMTIIRDSQDDEAREQCRILLEAIQRADFTILKGLALVNPKTPWLNLAEKNRAAVAAFLEGIAG